MMRTTRKLSTDGHRIFIVSVLSQCHLQHAWLRYRGLPEIKTVVYAVRCHNRGREEMSEAMKRNVHSPEFNTQVGLEAVNRAKTINEIGQEYGVYPVQVGQWKLRKLDRLARSIRQLLDTVEKFGTAEYWVEGFNAGH